MGFCNAKDAEFITQEQYIKYEGDCEDEINLLYINEYGNEPHNEARKYTDDIKVSKYNYKSGRINPFLIPYLHI